ncbi:MAG TPA: hypothetical protein VKX96_05700 [Chloroflexota bacterium]|nr:hypothetical protein [Chloroflexota bacterium]
MVEAETADANPIRDYDGCARDPNAGVRPYRANNRGSARKTIPSLPASDLQPYPAGRGCQMAGLFQTAQSGGSYVAELIITELVRRFKGQVRVLALSAALRLVEDKAQGATVLEVEAERQKPMM